MGGVGGWGARAARAARARARAHTHTAHPRPSSTGPCTFKPCAHAVGLLSSSCAVRSCEGRAPPSPLAHIRVFGPDLLEP